MLKGDLTSTPLAPLLLELAEDTATGCLHITDTAGEEALVYFKGGLVYSVSVPGTRPQLGAKLVSSGALAPEALAEALEAQRTELQGWRLGELLVHLGYVDQPVVEAFVKEQVSEALWDLLRWGAGRWKFRKNIKAREDVGPPMMVFELLETLRARGYEWETISAIVHGPAAVPMLSARGVTDGETTLDNDAWSMLCKIDGERSVADLARDCGYTLFEAGHVIVSLVQAGLVDIDEDIDVEGGELYGATTLSHALAGDLEDDVTDEAETSDEPLEEDALSKLARLVTEVAGDPVPDEAAALDPPPAEQPAAEAPADPAAAVALAPPQRTGRSYDGNPMIVPLHRHSSESFAASIARVSSALSDVLGEAPSISEEEAAQLTGPSRRRPTTSTSDPEWQRRKRLRTAAAAELATAQALIETLRPGHGRNTVAAAEYTGEVPRVLSRETERRRAASRDAEEAQRYAAEEAARVAAETFAKAAAEEAERHAAEQEALRQQAEHEAEVAAQAAEQAEVAAQQAEAAAQQAAAEAAAEAQAIADAAAAAEHAAADAARLQAEVEAAEETGWAEYWQREEAERHAAEQAAAAAAERLAAELAAQLAAQLAADEAERQAAAAEAERVAAEQAEWEAVQAAAEQERLAAEAAAEQERLAEAAAAEQERLAAEAAAEQERQAAEAELQAATRAQQLAAEEAERAAAQAQQLAAEEAERAAAEEIVHQAAIAKAERAARRKADKLAAEEAARNEDDAAAATAMLVELAATSEPAPEPAPEPAVAEQAPAEVEAEVREPASVGAMYADAGMADTAALLRELSSLGGDDDREPSGPTTTRAPRTTATNDKKVKKKIGLFGL
jgi:hypothetical protein